MKKALVLGGGGFIGSHMVKRLKNENYYVVGVDLKLPEYTKTVADNFYTTNLTNQSEVSEILAQEENFDEIYQYAADMGGAGFVFTGDNDADLMTNSASINLNLLSNLKENYKNLHNLKIFYSSSACMYPQDIQQETDNPGLKEEDAYPANPDSEYGWEKLFSERLYQSFNKNYGLDVRIARFHNTYGPEGAWTGGREKVPAAICRKVAIANDGEEIEVWGDGEQTRSFLYIDDCIEATRRLMNSDHTTPINIGSEEMVSINELVGIVSKVSEKDIKIKHIDGPLGVRGRNSNNDLIKKVLDWNFEYSLEDGITKTYSWIEKQIKAK
ncbi:NAD-dependent epimerase/dehydratase family protein [Acidimicrobiaceae bacterium]|jgi:GDP-D-mannose 3',5'-epimerase|nr:NAD-dependent epimerase/dehydratase family protein [Acidimicrobiaceae bacterium]